jgi:tryptophan synthase alpha chain
MSATIRTHLDGRSIAQGGVLHIQETFQQVQAANRPALMPYFTLGFPTPEISLDVIAAIAASGADLIELGLPFSDPLADGPTIQHSTQVALEQGVTSARCLEMVAELRARGVSQPLVLMGYINPLLAFGLERFVEAARAAGADGFIVPDLPPEEAQSLQSASVLHDLAVVFLAAPNATSERLQLVADQSQGFLYLVSLTGVTGARQQLPENLAAFIQRARQHCRLPLAVGFGISTPEQAGLVGRQADGVIVGSALIRAVAQSADPVQAARRFVHALRQGVNTCRMSGAADITELSA